MSEPENAAASRFFSRRDGVTLANPFALPGRGWNEVERTKFALATVSLGGVLRYAGAAGEAAELLERGRWGSGLLTGG